MKRSSTVFVSGDRRRGTRGTILVPCLMFMTLLSILSLSVLRVGGISNVVSGVLVEKSQTHLAAQSGLDIAYARLADDVGYSGEQCLPFRDSPCCVDISVTALEDSEFEILSRGALGDSETLIRATARAGSWISHYPLYVGRNLELKGKSTVIGDVFVNTIVSGASTAFIHGNLYLTGEREIQMSIDGYPSTIDGYRVPVVVRDVFVNTPPVDVSIFTLSNLREMAVQSGQVFSGTHHFTALDFDGVVFIEGCQSKVYFEDVTISGLLVCDDSTEVRVEQGFFKIHCRDDICANVAILAPHSSLRVNPDGLIDMYGLTYFESADFQGSGTFTGPVVIVNDMIAFPNSYLCCQLPSDMKEFSNAGVVWNEQRLVELSYEEY